jgi:outer membrane lipoprotein-sorting protein
MLRISHVAVAALIVSCLEAQDARQIIAESQKRSRASSERYQGLLQVIESSRKIAEKHWQYERIGSYGDSKSILRFTAPAEVKGVALLIVNHRERSSDQWMWTPAIGRERRIALQDRSTRFFGTDFSFEDLEERDVDQFDYKLLGEEQTGGAKCWRIEARPRQTKSSQYSASVLWIRQDHYIPAQIDNYVKEQVVRRLKYSGYEDVQGIWTARSLEMADLRRKSRTLLKLEKLAYNAPMKDDDFTVQALRRDE